MNRKPVKPVASQLPHRGAWFSLCLQEVLQLIWLTSSCLSSFLYSRCLTDSNESRRLYGCERDGSHHLHLKRKTRLIWTGCCCSYSSTVTKLVVFSTRMKPSCTLIVLSLEFYAVNPPSCDHLILTQNTPRSAADWWWLASTYADIMGLRRRQLCRNLPFHYDYTEVYNMTYPYFLHLSWK